MLDNTHTKTLLRALIHIVNIQNTQRLVSDIEKRQWET